jgi:hypothetical protein
VSRENGQAALDREDDVVRLKLLAELLAHADRTQEAVKHCERELAQAKRRRDDAELAVRCELRRMPRPKRGA